MDYTSKIQEIENNIRKINDIHDSISKKSNEVSAKIEMLNMKKALYKRNQISDSGMDNKTFVGDSNGANAVDPKSGTIVYTDPNVSST